MAQSFTVHDAKKIITETYPKLFGRFNYAFHGHEDTAPLSEVVEVITADVRTWLESMPDNFKTSNHALSRPKYGIVFVLKHAAVREALGDEYCNKAVDLIEKNWEDCKKDIVVTKDDVVTLESDDELRAKVDELTARNEMLSMALLGLVKQHYDAEMASIFKAMLSKI